MFGDSLRCRVVIEDLGTPGISGQVPHTICGNLTKRQVVKLRALIKRFLMFAFAELAFIVIDSSGPADSAYR
jgi:hypothetical protein